jgi:hypothetical protein
LFCSSSRAQCNSFAPEGCLPRGSRVPRVTLYGRSAILSSSPQATPADAAAAPSPWIYRPWLDLLVRCGATLTDATGAAADWFNYGRFLRRQHAPDALVLACFAKARELIGETRGALLSPVLQAQEEVQSGQRCGKARASRSAASAAGALRIAPESLPAGHWRFPVTVLCRLGVRGSPVRVLPELVSSGKLR